MAKEAQPELTDAQEAPDEPKRTRSVIADERLSAANQIMRILSDLTASERKAVMQIVNILVDNRLPSNPIKESE